MVSVKHFPKGLVLAGSLHSPTELTTENGAPAFSTLVALPVGQPLTRSILADVGKNHGLASLLKTGQVAVSFAVDPVRGVGGWVQPGDIIAIFETTREENLKQSLKKTRLLFSSVPVLAVDKRRIGLKSEESNSSDASAQPQDVEGGGVLTVVLNPVEASKLVEAREHGRLSILLRPLGDGEPWGPLAEEQP